jgi:ribosomal protein L6P/L9E
MLFKRYYLLPNILLDSLKDFSKNTKNKCFPIFTIGGLLSLTSFNTTLFTFLQLNRTSFCLNSNSFYKQLNLNNLINLFFSQMSNVTSALINGFFLFVNLFGIGFRVFSDLVSNFLKVEIGNSHSFFIPIPKELFVAARATSVFVFSLNKAIIYDFLIVLKGLRSKDPYKNKGFHCEFEFFKNKKGKVRN